MEKITAAITAVGGYVLKMSNHAMIRKMVDTNDERIYTRTGIKEDAYSKIPIKALPF